jgi:hypothetical protein|tara:strand:+ start:246 stop:443 length:198 start_codon:yes stop_codon:yes gene_type:complete
MFVIVLVMFMDSGYKVASDQVLYNSMDMCNSSLNTQMITLNASKPTPTSFVLGKCVEMPKPEKQT